METTVLLVSHVRFLGAELFTSSVLAAPLFTSCFGASQFSMRSVHIMFWCRRQSLAASRPRFFFAPSYSVGADGVTSAAMTDDVVISDVADNTIYDTLFSRCALRAVFSSGASFYRRHRRVAACNKSDTGAESAAIIAERVSFGNLSCFFDPSFYRFLLATDFRKLRRQ